MLHELETEGINTTAVRCVCRMCLCVSTRTCTMIWNWREIHNRRQLNRSVSSAQTASLDPFGHLAECPLD
jgi:hypothetical protein